MTTVLGLVFLALMVIGAPIAFAMLIAGLVAVWLKPGLSSLVVMQNLFSGLDSFPLMAIP
ncbi:TRAP transporter large permease subunit, partial [Hydrogenophaga sp.]|uniref:TRAP transporter large permease subunit n=2 Tax=unclassified Hydrogenophaga TaxID=2610897 RepID=UPI00345721E0